MAWLAIDSSGEEWIYESKPENEEMVNGNSYWYSSENCVKLKNGSI